MNRQWVIRGACVLGVGVVWLAACGRSELGARKVGGPGGSGFEAASGGGGADVAEGGGGAGGMAPEPCAGLPEQPCGSSLGECSQGVQTCQPDGFFGPCEGGVGPTDELCNDLDDDCDGDIDNGFNIGGACDGADSDLCTDDVISCDGCSLGPDLVEVCNGVDDNCNGEVDVDCEVGACSPSLLVTGSVPSSPNCRDLPVEAGSTGVINYPCQGGAVSATLGNIEFTGFVTNGNVSLAGSVEVIGPDGCSWRLDHSITGSIPAGTVQYFYEETLLTMPQGDCWFPCTEVGSVDIDWEP